MAQFDVSTMAFLMAFKIRINKRDESIDFVQSGGRCHPLDVFEVWIF